MIAEKKRQKWMREKGKRALGITRCTFSHLAEIERMQLEVEYDQLKHQLSPRHQKSESPGKESEGKCASDVLFLHSSARTLDFSKRSFVDEQATRSSSSDAKQPSA